MPSQRFLTGLIGDDIGRSRSPAIHEREADAHGVRLIYKLYDLAASGWSADDLPALLNAGKQLGFSGFNVTHPYKQAVMAHLDAINPAAERIGAVNTVRLANGLATGFNTDCEGFAEGLTRGLPDAKFETVVQLGAGGAGSATAHALLDHGVRQLILFETDTERARSLAGRLTAAHPEARVSIATDLARAVEQADGLVNATPVGMDAHPGMPIPSKLLRSDLWVADIIYFPIETELLRRARGLGCPTLDGTRMVVFQAASAFEHFTGLQADRERMLRAFRDAL